MDTALCMDWVRRDMQVIAPCQHLSYFPLVIRQVDGAMITDEDGNRYVDFLSSASSLNLGGNHPVIAQAVRAQLEHSMQYTAAYSYNAPMIEYAERLASVYPGGITAKVCFGNCGSDANDAAVKFARAYTGRSKIITFFHAYHGNTYGSATLSTITPRMRRKMGPFLPEVYHFPFFGADVDDADCARDCLLELLRAFETYLPAEDVAAVIIEPMQGDGGLIPAHPRFLKELYRLCRQKGILFIAEEVQQAFFRTGPMHWFSIEHYDGIIPDGIVLGKSLGAGLTLGAFLGRAEIMDALPAPAHVFTLGGNALSCAAGIAAFDYMKGDAFQTQLTDTCDRFQRKIQTLCRAFPKLLGRVHGLGMSYGIEVLHKDSETPDPNGAYQICYRAYEYGTILITLAGNILRIQPPLTIQPEQLEQGFQNLHRAVADHAAGRIPESVLQFRQGW